MDIYTLEPENLNKDYSIEGYESLIWTERFNELGDFELVVPTSQRFREILTPDTFLSIDESTRMMVIETVESKDDETSHLMTIKGRSFEKILEDRVASNSNWATGSPAVGVWTISNTMPEILRRTFNHICSLQEGVFIEADAIPQLMASSHVEYESVYRTGTIPEPTDVLMDFNIPVTSLLNFIRDTCKLYDFGFRMGLPSNSKNGNPFQRWPGIYFEPYMGNDRTSTQDDLSPIIFSPSLDNLSNIHELESSQNYKNIAYVRALNGKMMVDPYFEAPSGVDRRVLYVDALDITAVPGATLNSLMLQRGLEELGMKNKISIFDGEVRQNFDFVYDVDYNLGDLVEFRLENQESKIMRVTEQIFISDANGVQSYPSFSIHQP